MVLYFIARIVSLYSVNVNWGNFLMTTENPLRILPRPPPQTKRAYMCRNTTSTLEPQPSIERMKLMTRHTSARPRQHTPHANRTTRTATIIDALKRRAQAVLNDTSLDPQTRAVIRYAMEINEPWLAKLVRRAETDEAINNTLDFSRSRDTNEHSPNEHVSDDVSSQQKIEALAEIICRGSDESPAALLVLMGMLESANDPHALANTAKHYAFNRCGELNLFEMVDAQILVAEGELLAGR